MSKAKSKKVTIEEALISLEEQPFKIPENWCWTRVASVSQVIMGQSPSGESTTDDDSYIPLIGGAGDMGEVYPEVSRYTKEPTKLSQEGDLILCIRATLGKPIYSDGQYCLGRGVAGIRSKYISKEFLKYIYLFNEQYLYDNATGSTFAQVTSKVLEKMPIPFPPLNEQKRIVEKIEYYFSRLDEAKEKAQGIIDRFEDSWAAISYAAFSGKLTETWRKKNSIAKEWREYTLQEVCSMKITDGTHQTPTYCEKEDGGVPFISAKDVTSKKICWDDIKYIVPELHDELYARIAPQKDDVLLAKNGTTGVAAIVDTDRIFDIYVTLAVLRPNKDIIVPRYLYNIINSPVCKNQFDSHLTGIGVPNLHLRDIKEVRIMVPDEEEQKEVVSIIDGIWEKYEKTIEIVRDVINSIDIMKKTILFKAFKGELGTNNIQDEAAIEFLGRMLEDCD